MMVKRFAAKTKVDLYSTDQEYGLENIEILNLLNSNEKLRGWVVPLRFLNLVHKRFTMAQARYKQPTAFVEQVKAISPKDYLKLIVREKHFSLQTTKDEEWFRFTMQSLVYIALLKLLHKLLSTKNLPELVPTYKFLFEELSKLKASKNQTKNIGVTFPDIDIPDIDGIYNPKSQKTFKSNISESLTFENLFVNTSDYKKIIHLLADKKWIDKDSKQWKCETSGNKTLLASIIKFHYRFGYALKKQRITNDEVCIIAKNSFNCVFSIDTAKKAKFVFKELDFLISQQTTSS